MGITSRQLNTTKELRSLQDLSYRVWLHDPALLNFEASYGTLAWERGGPGNDKVRHSRQRSTKQMTSRER